MTMRLKIVFGLSLLLNLIIMGSILGFALHWYWGDRDHFAPQAMRSHIFEHIIDDIPEAEKRNMLLQEFLVLKNQNADLSRSIHNNRAQMRHIVNTDPFDEASYQDNIKRILEAKRATEYSYALLLGKVIQALPMDERDDVLKWLYRGARGKKKHHGKRHD